MTELEFDIDYLVNQIEQTKLGIDNGNWEGFSENLQERKKLLKERQNKLIDLLSPFEVDMSKLPYSSIGFQMHEFGIRSFILFGIKGKKTYAEYKGLFCERELPIMKSKFGFTPDLKRQDPDAKHEQLTLF